MNAFEDKVSFCIFSDEVIDLVQRGKDFAAGAQMRELEATITARLAELKTVYGDYLQEEYDIAGYIWHGDKFHIAPITPPFPIKNPTRKHQIPHLRGSVRFGENIQDEWFVTFLLFRLSSRFNVTISIKDNDGQFILIQAAAALPDWLEPDTSKHRVWIRGGKLQIFPQSIDTTKNLLDLLNSIRFGLFRFIRSDQIQALVTPKFVPFNKSPESRDRELTFRFRCAIPASVARILIQNPQIISIIISTFYTRDSIDAQASAFMRKIHEMEKINKGEDRNIMVLAVVKCSRFQYAQLLKQSFHEPKIWQKMIQQMQLDKQNFSFTAKEIDLGIKISCGFEMAYHKHSAVRDLVDRAHRADGGIPPVGEWDEDESWMDVTQEDFDDILSKMKHELQTEETGETKSAKGFAMFDGIVRDVNNFVETETPAHEGIDTTAKAAETADDEVGLDPAKFFAALGVDQEGSADPVLVALMQQMEAELHGEFKSESFVMEEEEEEEQKQEEEKQESGNNSFKSVNLDLNLVQNFLESFDAQEGTAGPASNLLAMLNLED
eukprot:TRINITY_DN1901_c0_g1_i2.p1 TRINITY_DN1901_c0_g1~~TRINITY_DN1901_c0_g1_i2.p1  ORF type:complete len:550 (+),score=109.78 TRINITY_DN1901_c0_g1_i2:124-1773(+)